MVSSPKILIGKRLGKTSFIWIAIIFGAVYVSGLLTDVGKKELEIEYTEYKQYLENGDIAKGVIMGDVFHGEFKESKSIDAPYGNKIDNVITFQTNPSLLLTETS